MVPLFDPRPQHERVRAEVTDAVTRVLDSGQFIMGTEVQALERDMAHFHGVKHALGVASGTDALHLALRAAGLGQGDEVITTPFTFVATIEAIYYCGATPVFADIHPRTMNLDPAAAAAVMTDRTRAIVPVHLFGLSADIEPLMALAKKHKLRVIGDCAQAFGTRYAGHSIATFGDANCFSFFPTKNLGGYGDGGLITTNSDTLAAAICTLRNHGSRERYHHHQVGYNSRLDEIQAAALRVKLRYVEEFNESRRAIAAIYNRDLAGLGIGLPVTPIDCHHTYGQYTIQLSHRDQLRALLEQHNIGSAIYYPVPLHHQEVCRDAFQGQRFRNCERVAKRCLSLPVFPGMTESQAFQVVSAIRAALPELKQQRERCAQRPLSVKTAS